MNFEFYIAKRLTFQSKRTFSKTVVTLAISAIALSIAVMLISIAIAKGFQAEIKKKLTGFSTHIQITQTSINYTFENEPINFDTFIYKKIKKIADVKNIEVFATKPGIIRTDKAIEGIVLKGVSTDFDWNYIKNSLSEGNILNLSKPEPADEIIISKTIAKKLGLRLNDHVIVYFIQQPSRVRKFKVCGIYETGLEDIDNIFTVCDIRHIVKLNNWSSNQIGGYEIILKNLKNLERANELIRVMLDIHQDTKTIKDIYPQIFDWLGLLDMNVRIIIILMIIIATVNMMTALLIIILEKSHLIALFKSFGSKNSVISRIFLFNSILLIICGLVIGDVLGLGLLFIQYHFRVFTLPVESYYVSFIPVLFTWKYFIIINIGTFIICSMIMYIPALFISKIDPVRVLRFE